MTVRTVAVLGAGIMGRGIAYASTLGANKRLTIVRSLEDATKAADLVIEAIPERIELKIELFAKLDRLAPREAIIASNTSSLSITEMAAATTRAASVVGMHFFNPVHRMKLLEVVRALETSDATIAAACDVGEKMGKECVVVRESPGFVTSRINAMIGNEAFYMLEAGVAKRAVPRKAKRAAPRKAKRAAPRKAKRASAPTRASRRPSPRRSAASHRRRRAQTLHGYDEGDSAVSDREGAHLGAGRDQGMLPRPRTSPWARARVPRETILPPGHARPRYLARLEPRCAAHRRRWKDYDSATGDRQQAPCGPARVVLGPDRFAC